MLRLLLLTVAAASPSSAATRTSAGSSPAVGSSTTSTEAAAAVGASTTSTGSAAGMGTATAKTAAVRTVIAMPVDTAKPCLDAADVVVDDCAFRVTPRAHGVVLIQHETL
jgi:hypothetical protein